MRRINGIIVLVIVVIFAFETVATASDISKGIPGLKWGDSIKNAKGYKLQHCGEPDIKGEPSFFTIISPEDFKLIGISSKTHRAWTHPILWTYNNRLMGVQFDLTDTRSSISAMIKSLGEPSRRFSNNTTFGIYEWDINGVIRIKGIDIRNGYLVTIYHRPTLKKLNGVRRSMGKSIWD